MDEILLSVCISTYNRSTQCYNLVENILKLEDDRFNIVVCDDGSDDDTVEKLSMIKSDKLIIVKNEHNVGPCPNWYRTINCGTGKYLLHVLDRDSVLQNKIKKLLDLLEKHEVSGGYIGKWNRGVRINKGGIIFNQGMDAFCEIAGVPIHPTGFFVKRECWEYLSCKKFFYKKEKYGIYPHSYVMGYLALTGDLLCVWEDFFSTRNIGTNKVSRFYGKKPGKDYWWLPDNMLKEAVRLIYYLLPQVEEYCKEEFIYRRFQEELYRATIIYREIVGSKMEMRRYGTEIKKVSQSELLLIAVKHTGTFCFFAEKMKVNKKACFDIVRYGLSYACDLLGIHVKRL